MLEGLSGSQSSISEGGFHELPPGGVGVNCAKPLSTRSETDFVLLLYPDLGVGVIRLTVLGAVEAVAGLYILLLVTVA